MLIDKSLSMPESAIRIMMIACGLPEPETNQAVRIEGQTRWADLWLAKWQTAIEYEDTHHQLDRHQYLRDILRYDQFRSHGVSYIQVTKELLDQPRALMMHIHKRLVRQGYAGQAPTFGGRWHALFQPIKASSTAQEVE